MTSSASARPRPSRPARPHTGRPARTTARDGARPAPGRVVIGGASLALGALALGELVSACASRRERARLGEGPHGGLEVIVVLGFGNPGAVINAVNRWRVEVGLRSRDPRAARTRMVMTGGTVHGEISEAEHLARWARSGRRYDGELLLEDQSITTWENVRNVLPLLEDAERIVLASDPLHALRAQGFLRALRPDLAARLAPARDHVPGEQLLRKPSFAVLGLEGLRQARRDGLMA